MTKITRSFLAILALIGLAACSTGTVLARASNPSPKAGAPFEECIDRVQKVYQRADPTDKNTAGKAAADCHANRASEVSRDTATANAAAQAAMNEGRVYGRYDGRWYGDGIYGDVFMSDRFSRQPLTPDEWRRLNGMRDAKPMRR